MEAVCALHSRDDSGPFLASCDATSRPRAFCASLCRTVLKYFSQNRPAAPLCVIEEVKRPSDLEEKKSRVVFSSCRVISFSSCEFMERGSLPTVCSACGLSSYLSINKSYSLLQFPQIFREKGYRVVFLRKSICLSIFIINVHGVTL